MVINTEIRRLILERAGKSAWSILLEQFTGIMVVILIISAIISAILGETIDAIVIMIIVVLNAVLGFVQEYRAERAMAALKQNGRSTRSRPA